MYTGGGRRFGVEFIPGLFFNFPVAEWAGPDDETRSLSFAADIAVVCPSITEIMTIERFSELFEANMRIYRMEEDDEFADEGDFIFYGYFNIDRELLISRYEYLNTEYWADKVAIELAANLGGNQYITPDTLFSIGPIAKNRLSSFDYDE
jgi:hypothetical protein